jgi:purine-nucleoside phosphorylase
MNDNCHSTHQDNLAMIRLAADFLRTASSFQPTIGLILGSGLNSIVADFSEAIHIPFERIPHFPPSTVEGHHGEIVFGKLEGVPVIALSGRYHFYEGYQLDVVTFPVRVMRQLGVETLVLTNACGAVNLKFQPGDLMLITDHINLVGLDPLIGPNLKEFGPRFPDATEIYSKKLRAVATQSAASLGFSLQEGVYAWWSGPSYETPAEIRMIRILGGDAIGMSTVPEALVANHMGMRILGISCLTNMASGILDQKLSHQEVLDVAKRVNSRFSALVRDIVKRIDAHEGV